MYFPPNNIRLCHEPTNQKCLFIIQLQFIQSPIGGFETTWAGVVEPDTLLETDYIFYSRNWGPGEVKYTLTGSYIDKQFVSDPQLFHIDPSSFKAEPGQIYKSHVFLNTSYIPDYKAPGFLHGGMIHPASLNIHVSLEDNSSSFGDDGMIFYPGLLTSGPYSWNQLSIDNCSIRINPGETKTFNASFREDYKGNIGKISFISLNTPLNFTITPSEYIAKPGLDFPSVVSISADLSLAQGQYQINTTINGTKAFATMVHCRDTDSNDLYDRGRLPPNIFFPLNVTVI